ncbi:ParB/RepB/Spo0J family partition protein [Leptolyngbya sp. FACHB-321]|uniref:ParB/RepB/Spo0J family partition protein n=1 Tax=Leptolyngbya sp. FACHB-321 TaxID=2692807 RepID=UPI001687642E|nr:ParB/RepB/Spo0J family partition protein [Leptolyngbya sp. FACHB-321]MBD2038269.1 ParB/RepB/Spo0J family partition protein [Leptolyngbya sp. FACHB-321]
MARRNSLKDEWKFEPELVSNNQSIAIDAITLPASQPRRYFDPQKLQQLTESVRQHGILEPLLVRPAGKTGLFELVAGERRFRAAKAVGLTAVPVTIRELSDEDSLQLALVENLQREDLNPVEETEGVLQLLGLRLNVPSMDVPPLLYRMRNEAIGNTNQNVLINSEAQAVEKVFAELGTISWESFATTRLPLLRLPPEILEALRSGKIAYTKAQAIARIKDDQQRRQLLLEAISQDLSLTQIKTEIANLKVVKEDAEAGDSSLKSQIDDVLRLAKRSQVWANPKKQRRLKKLLAELKTLIVGED